MSAGNPSYKPSEGKREEFRKYLEKNGVMDALTKVLVNLYEEVDKPEDALEYIRDKLAVIGGLETHKQLQNKLTEAEERIRELETQLEGAGGEADRDAGQGASEETAAEPPGDEGLNLPDEDAPADEAAEIID